MNTLPEEAQSAQGHTKEYSIVVNGRQKVVTEKELSYTQVVALAFENPHTEENWLYVVTFTRGEGNKKGDMEPGDVEKVKEGMIFNVTETNRS